MRIAEDFMLDAMRQKFALFAREQGRWHSEMERFSAAEMLWAEEKERLWSPEYSEWWAERRLWHGRRRRFWEFFGRVAFTPTNQINLSGPVVYNKAALIHEGDGRLRPHL